MNEDELVLVPSERHVERLARAGRRAESFGAFIERLAGALVPHVAIASRGARVLALARAVRRVEELASIETRAAGAAFSTLDAVDRAVGALDGARIDSREARESARLAPIARVRDDYAATLARASLTDPRALVGRVADAVRDAPHERVRDAVGATHVRVRWIVDFSRSDVSLVAALDACLSRVNGSARIVLPTFDAPFDGARDRDVLETIADRVSALLEDAPDFERIEARLGDGVWLGDVPSETLARAVVHRARDGEGQARAVARHVARAIARGVPPEMIAVMTPRRDARTMATLARALDDAGIVAHVPRAEGADRGVVAFALDWLASLDEGGAKAPAGGAEYLRGADADALRASASASMDRAAKARAARALFAALAPRAGRGAWGTLARDESARGAARAELVALARDVRGIEAAVRALADYASACATLDAGDEVISWARFREEIARTMEHDAGRSGARAGAVRVVRAREIAGEALALLVVVDANDGVLPLAPDPLVAEAQQLGASSAGPGATSEARAHTDAQLAALALAAASAESIVLLHRSYDDADALLAPSALVAWLERGGATKLEESASPVSPDPASPRDRRLTAFARNHRVADRVSPNVARRARTEITREAFFLDKKRTLSPEVGELAPERTLTIALTEETGGATRPLAVTSLERFATCAFQGFAAEVLGAKDVALEREIPDARHEGTLVHTGLCAAFRATASLWDARPRAAAHIREVARSAVDAALATLEPAGEIASVVHTRVQEITHAQIDRAIEDTEWNFARAEQTFGGASRDGSTSWPALVLFDGETKLTLRGSIDRVDVARENAEVRAVDYKRRKTTIDKAAAELGETVFQVPIYARVASAALGPARAEGLYLPTMRRDLATYRGPTDNARDRWNTLFVEKNGLIEIEHRALAIVKRIRRGSLAPLPKHEAACRNCAASGGCRKPRFAIAAEEDDE